MKNDLKKYMSSDEIEEMNRLKEELHNLKLSDSDYQSLVNKSQEFDKYINKMMKFINLDLDNKE